MKHVLITLPVSLVVATFAARFCLATLGMPLTTGWLLGAILLCTCLLFGRGIVELGAVAGITLFAQLNSSNLGLGYQAVSPDLIVALLLTVIVLPFAMSVFDIDTRGSH